jgi:hypothetical protein
MSIDRSADLKWQRHLVIGDGGRIFVRPIAQNDGLMIRDLLAHVSREDLRLRFFDSIKEFSPQFIAGLIDIGGLYVTALVAIDEASSEMLGVLAPRRRTPEDRRMRDPTEIRSQRQRPWLGLNATDDRIRKVRAA